MDDLLSAALTESGLDEFFIPNAPYTVDGNQAASCSNSEVDASPSTNFIVEAQSATPSPLLTPSSLQTNSPTEVRVPSSSEQGRGFCESDGVPTSSASFAGGSRLHDPQQPSTSTSPTIFHSASTNSLPTTNGNGTTSRIGANRPMIPGRPGEGLIRRYVQTPDGPKQKIFKEKGETVYREVRNVSLNTNGNTTSPGVKVISRVTPNASGIQATVGSTVQPSNGPANRIVYVRQMGPNGMQLVKKTVPAGAVISRGGNVVRRIVTRGANQPGMQRIVSSSEIGRPNTHNQVHMDTGHQYISSSPAVRTVPRVLRGGSSATRLLNQRGGINGSMSRTSSGTGLGMSRIAAGYSPIARSNVPGISPAGTQRFKPGGPTSFNTQRKTSLTGIGGSTPTLSSLAGHEYLSSEPMPIFENLPSYMEKKPETNPLPQFESYSTYNRPTPSHRIPNMNIKRAPQVLPRSLAGAEPVGAFDRIDMKSLLSPVTKNADAKAKPDVPKEPSTKLQKAKDEMKTALSTAAEKRDMEEEEENLGYAETYSDYRPAKLRSGLSHPDSVVETASLSSVAPPDVRYQITIPEQLIDTGAISALQLEAVIYACQAHEQRLPSNERCGYLIGDGAGVGKGRTVACIIYENYLLGRKRSIWLSVSADLKFDSERDLRDIGASKISVHALNKLKYAKISGKENGGIKKGCIFATYSSLIGECRTAKPKYRSRLKQLVQWFGVDYDGVIILDECHRAKNLCPTAGGKSTKTGKMVLDLQKMLPNARVVYASATGATEPRNMAYMTRIGLWGEGQAFPEFTDFINAVERRGVGAMEIVAMDMKQRGLYLARQLSFRGVAFTVEEVPLSDAFIKVYDESVKLWMECRRQFQLVLSTMSDEERSGCKQVWGQFWACHQRFFKYLCIGAKVDVCVRMTREAIKTNKCVVIGLQSTGEARTLETLEEMGGELTEFVSTSKAVLQGLIDKHFPTEKGTYKDVFRDFDKMFDDFEKPRKRKNRSAHPLGFDVLEELGLGLGPTLDSSPIAKKRREDGASSASSDDSGSDDSDDDGEDASDESDTDSNGEVNLGDKEEDWVNALLNEAASSSDSDEGNDDSDDDGKTQDKSGANTDAEEEFNPFNCDFSRGDPWASKQQIVDDSPKKKTREEAEARRDRKKAKRRRKRRMEKEREKEEKKKEKRELNTQAMQGTATQFISSSRIIEGNGFGSDINPQMIKAELLAAVERLGPSLPANTLDQLIDELGGPEFVAEMTGRKGRVVTREDGEVEYELRHTGADVPLELMNMDEKDKFMKGEKLVAVISEAASSGISLQSDRRAPNQRRRTHITLELPWSADKAIQQFGRTHRSNQVSAPEYVFLISELAGEKRFASIVAKRLESLGALTHGDRRATESRDLSQFNLDTKYGRSALDVLLKSVIGTLIPPLIEPPASYKSGDFFNDMRLYMEGVGILSRLDNGQYIVEREAANISKFLNRILGLPVHAQNALFQYFTEIVNELVTQAKHDGTYDMGIMDLGTGGDQVRKQETRVFLGRVEKGGFRVEIHKIGVERGVSWEDAFAIYKEHNTGEDGFYLSTPNTSGRRVAVLVYGIGKRRLDTGARLYAVTRASTGRSPKMETFSELAKRFHKIHPEQAEKHWKEQYESANQMCQHAFAHGRCRNEEKGHYCEVGRRTRTYFVLSGSVLSVWPVVEEVLDGPDRRVSRMQVIRVRTDTDQKIVGILVLPQFVRSLLARMEEHCGRCFVENKK